MDPLPERARWESRLEFCPPQHPVYRGPIVSNDVTSGCVCPSIMRSYIRQYFPIIVERNWGFTLTRMRREGFTGAYTQHREYEWWFMENVETEREGICLRFGHRTDMLQSQLVEVGTYNAITSAGNGFMPGDLAYVLRLRDDGIVMYELLYVSIWNDDNRGTTGWVRNRSYQWSPGTRDRGGAGFSLLKLERRARNWIVCLLNFMVTI